MRLRFFCAFSAGFCVCVDMHIYFTIVRYACVFAIVLDESSRECIPGVYRAKAGKTRSCPVCIMFWSDNFLPDMCFLPTGRLVRRTD